MRKTILMRALPALFAGLLLASPSLAATATRVSTFEYDPASGLLTKEIVEPDQTQFRLETTYTYDVFGNRTAATVSSPATGLQAITSRTSSTGFDSSGRFATTATNALNQSETRSFHAGLGVADLPPGFRTTDYVRDWLHAGEGACASRGSRKSRWSRSSARRIATGYRRRPSGTRSANRRCMCGRSASARSSPMMSGD